MSSNIHPVLARGGRERKNDDESLGLMVWTDILSAMQQSLYSWHLALWMACTATLSDSHPGVIACSNDGLFSRKPNTFKEKKISVSSYFLAILKHPACPSMKKETDGVTLARSRTTHTVRAIPGPCWQRSVMAGAASLLGQTDSFSCLLRVIEKCGCSSRPTPKAMARP
jgi:hypothetical protein